MTEIVYYEGCDYSLTINGTEFVDLSLDEQIDTCRKIIDSGLLKESTMQRFIECFASDTGVYENLGHCDTCGSENDQYTVKLT